MLRFKKGNCITRLLVLIWLLTIVSFNDFACKAENDNRNGTLATSVLKDSSNATKSNATDARDNLPLPKSVSELSPIIGTNGTIGSTNQSDTTQQHHESSPSGNVTTGTSNHTTVVDTDALKSNKTDSSSDKNETQSKDSGETCDSVEHSFFLLPIHLVVCVYSFLGIAVTCHKYFLPSLGRICEVMKMSEDVVGATFMAAGSSAPELATVLIAVFVTHNDIGISDVIGSALFNLLFVVSLCSFLSTTVIRLNWWPLCRNCFFYAVSVMFMLVAIHDGQVNWFESSILLALYVLYCVALYYNVLLEAWAYTLPLPFNKLVIEEPTTIVKEANGNVIPLQTTKQTVYDTTTNNIADNSSGFHQPTEKTLTSPVQTTTTTDQVPDDGDDGNQLSPDANFFQRFQWYTLYPIYFVCKYTIPDCQKKQFSNWFIITFFMSMVSISLYSYLLVWMITLIGVTLHITETVMGLTLLAAGVSVPDAITSIDVVRKGYGDMGISNVVGSNIFDVLVCLGLPWFLKTVIVNPGGYVEVESIGMRYSTLLLFSSIALLVITASWNRWVLNKAFGIILMVGYVVFVGIAVAIELTKGATPNCN